jgi:predicted small secreted protein
LIVDGEELIGAKQNRIVNLTILVPAHSELTIPVTCVEAGRWRAKSRAFKSAPRAQYSSGRAKRMSQVSRSMAFEGLQCSDQAEVWSDIAAKSVRLRSSSPTGAMEAMFVQHAGFIDACVGRCQPVDRQVGALFAVDNAIVGFDLFDAPQSLRALLPKLVRSVAVDALDHRDHPVFSRVAGADGGTVTFATALFLGAVSTAVCHSTPAIGVGQDLRITGAAVTGAALVNGGRVVHLSAFALA